LAISALLWKQTIECVEGLRQADGGSIRVLDLDPQREGYKLRERIGIQFQTAALPPRIKVGEALDLFAAFYRHPVDWRQLLAQMGLADRANAYLAKLSSGQRQRIFIALATGNPLLLADEPTGELDFQTGIQILTLLEAQAATGKTVLVVTHNREISRIADRVVELSSGHIENDGPPRGGKAAIGDLHW
jgi:ABC-type multidrug transport system ATPase subunit